VKKFIALIVGVLLVGSSPNAGAAETLSITESSDYTAVVEVVGQIWKGKIPTRIAYPAGSSSQKLEFQIQGILPQSVLGNRATGTDVEFEIWSDAGKKIAYDTVYSSDWNPVGPNTLVSMYLYESEAIGTHTMIVRTIYELSTTGLLTRYIKSEQRFTVRIVSAVKPAQVDLTSASDFTNNVGYALGTKYSFTPLSTPAITRYEVGLLIMKSPGLDPAANANYLDPVVLKTINSGNFELYYEDLKPELLKYMSDLSNSAFIIKVRAVSEGGAGIWGKGYYTLTKEILNAEATKKQLAETAETQRLDRIARCSATNTAIPQLGSLVDSYISKYPMNSTFTSLKSEIPAQLNCGSAGDPSMASTISDQDAKLASIDQRLTYAMQLADRPPASKKTITCLKGKVTKKVTGIAPKCPAGYKKK
jgi:hypothetical protein